MSQFLAYLSQSFTTAEPYVPIVIIVVAGIVFILVILLVIWVIYKLLMLFGTLLMAGGRYIASQIVKLWKKRKKPVVTEEPSPVLYAIGPSQTEPSRPKKCFKYIVNLLKRLGRTSDIYDIPWYLVIGSNTSGKTSIIQDSGLGFPFGVNSSTSEIAECSAWITGEAVMIEARGALLVDEKKSKFKQLIKEISRKRPRRPLDGVLLAISIHELEAGLRGSETLSDLAQNIMELFAICENRLGFRLPVYIIVTHLDQKPDFSNFALSLDELQTRGIFGWSNTRHPDDPFERIWIEEALKTLEQDIINLWLTQPVSPQVSSAGVQLPSIILSLKEPLNVLCGRLFRTGQHFQSFALRGIYFTGRSENIDTSQILSEIGEKRYFLRDLFMDKIIPERGVGHPLPFHLRQATRYYRLVMASSIVGMLFFVGITVIGILESIENVSQLRRHTTALANEVSHSWASLTFTTLNVTPEPEIVERIINTVSDIQQQYTTHLFLPASWFSSVPYKLQQINAHTIRGYLLQHLHSSLEVRLEESIDTNNNYFTVDRGTINPAEFYGRGLQNYVDKVVEAESQLSSYENFLEDPENVNLIPLLSYAFGQKLQWTPILSEVLTYDLLSRVRLVDISRAKMSQAATENFQRVLAEYVLRIILQNPLTQTAEDIQTLSRTLLDQPDQVTLEQLRELQTLLNNLEDFLSRSDLAWIYDTRIQDDRTFNQVIGRVASNPLFGVQLATSLTLDTEAQRREVRRVIDTYESVLFGRIFNRQGQGEDGDGVLRLTREAQNFITSLNFFLSSSFLQVDENLTLSQITGDQPFTWNIQRLNAATQHIQEFDRYFNTPQPAISDQLNRTLRRIAATNLVVAIENELIRAIDLQLVLQARFGSLSAERQIVEIISNFNRARPLLDTISRTFVAHTPERSEILASIMASQVVRLLGQAHSLLREEDPYGFLRIIPVTADPEQAVDDIISVGLEERLNQARERLRILFDEFASASLDILATRGASAIFERQDLQKVEDWQITQQILEGYSRNETDNVLIRIERITRQMTLSDGVQLCAAASNLSTEQQPPVSNYLGQVLIRVSQALRARCNAWKQYQTYTSLQTFSNFYKNSVSGTIPFVPTRGASGSVSVPVFTQLLTRYEILKNDLKEVEASLTSLTPQWREFIQNMDTVITAFPVSENNQGKFVDVHLEFSVQFRARSNLSQLTEHVIEWQFQTGNSLISDRDTETIRIWRYNNPITLFIRWARNSPYRPENSSELIELGWQKVNDTTVSMTFEQPWSLFEFLETYTVPQDNPGGGVLLHFTLPVYRPVDLVKGTLSTFIEMRFYDAGTPITLPSFPKELPDIPIQTQTVGLN